MVDFAYLVSNFSSTDHKMEVLEMIDRVNANSNVGEVRISIDSKYMKWNSEILIMMMNRYRNVYHIDLNQRNDQVDYETYKIIKQWV